MAKAKRKGSSSGDETKARIVEATLETLKTEGIVGTSARAIARAGDFNQALIFYHFGSVDDAIIAGVAYLCEVRLERHQAQLEGATSLSDFLTVARELHRRDAAEGNMTVLAQAFAGAAGESDMGPRLYDLLAPWTNLVSDSVQRVLGAEAGSIVPHETIAQAIGALFVGITLIDNLDPERHSAEELFDTLGALAVLLDGLLRSPLADTLAAISAAPEP